MFQFPGFVFLSDDRTFSIGLPHSDMYGSIDACSSPYLFAAYRVLLRLLAPRHPPYALVHLTYQYCLVIIIPASALSSAWYHNNCRNLFLHFIILLIKCHLCYKFIRFILAYFFIILCAWSNYSLAILIFTSLALVIIVLCFSSV